MVQNVVEEISLSSWRRREGIKSIKLPLEHLRGKNIIGVLKGNVNGEKIHLLKTHRKHKSKDRKIKKRVHG